MVVMVLLILLVVLGAASTEPSTGAGEMRLSPERKRTMFHGCSASCDVMLIPKYQRPPDDPARTQESFRGKGSGGYIPLYATADSDYLAGQCMHPGECQWAT